MRAANCTIMLAGSAPCPLQARFGDPAAETKVPGSGATNQPLSAARQVGGAGWKPCVLLARRAAIPWCR